MKLPNILTALASSAKQHPDGIAVIESEDKWTYQQLWDSVKETKEKLGNLSLPPKSSIAVTAYKSVPTLTLMLALGLRGHTPLAISPDLGHSIKPSIFKKANIYCELTSTLKQGISTIDISFKDEHRKRAEPNIYFHSPLMLTTSGSTGIPKVVSLNAEGINAFFNWASNFFDITRKSRILSYSPLNFDLSLLEVWTTLALGGTVIFVNSKKATQAGYLVSLIERTKPHLIQGVPILYSLLCEGIETIPNQVFDTKHIIFTGDVFPKPLRQKVARIFPKSTFHNIYGCTETNNSFVHTSSARKIITHKRLPLGIPIQGTAYRIVDDLGNDLGISGEGELHISTPFLAHGYIDSEKSSAAFYWDETERRRYYKTGDKVTLNENGTLTFFGRNDHIVKVRGVRTNLQNIEYIICLSNLVNEAVVMPFNDDLYGVIIHAVIEPKNNKTFDSLALRRLCSQHLPLTSVPHRFHVHESPIPRTPTGKVERKKIMQFIQSKEI